MYICIGILIGLDINFIILNFFEIIIKIINMEFVFEICC